MKRTTKILINGIIIALLVYAILTANNYHLSLSSVEAKISKHQDVEDIFFFGKHDDHILVYTDKHIIQYDIFKLLNIIKIENKITFPKETRIFRDMNHSRWYQIEPPVDFYTERFDPNTLQFEEILDPTIGLTRNKKNFVAREDRYDDQIVIRDKSNIRHLSIKNRLVAEGETLKDPSVLTIIDASGSKTEVEHYSEMLKDHFINPTNAFRDYMSMFDPNILESNEFKFLFSVPLNNGIDSPTISDYYERNGTVFFSTFNYDGVDTNTKVLRLGDGSFVLNPVLSSEVIKFLRR